LLCTGFEKKVSSYEDIFSYPDKPKKDHFRIGLGWYDRCAGSEGSRQIFDVVEAVVHEKYDPSGKFFDIALMKMDKKTNYPPACLPIARKNYSNINFGKGESEQ